MAEYDASVWESEPLLSKEELKALLSEQLKHNPPNPLDYSNLDIVPLSEEQIKELEKEIRILAATYEVSSDDTVVPSAETPVVFTNSILIDDLEKFNVALDGNQQCGSLFGLSEFSGQLSGHALIKDRGIIPKDICGKTIKIEVSLTVTAAQLVPGVNDPSKLSLTFTGNPSDLVGKLHVEDTPSEEKDEDCHRFTGFMDNPKDF